MINNVSEEFDYLAYIQAEFILQEYQDLYRNRIFVLIIFIICWKRPKHAQLITTCYGQAQNGVCFKIIFPIHQLGTERMTSLPLTHRPQMACPVFYRYQLHQACRWWFPNSILKLNNLIIIVTLMK